MVSFFGCIIPDSKISTWRGTSPASNLFQKKFCGYFDTENTEVFSVVSGTRHSSVLLEDGRRVELVRKPRGPLGPLVVLCRVTSLIIISFLARRTIVQFNPEYYAYFLPYLARLMGGTSVLILSDFTEPSEQRGWVRKSAARLLAWSILAHKRIVVLSDSRLVKNHLCTLKYRGAIHLSEYLAIEPRIPSTTVYRFLYAGTFNEVGGLPLLLAAFASLVDTDLELHLSGIGDLAGMADPAVLRDPRIINHGFVSRSKLLELYSMADALVNPRDMRFIQNRNNFPSKVLEYLATGRTIVTTRFSGIDSFSDVRFIEAASTPQGIADALIRARRTSKEDVLLTFQVNRKVAEEYDTFRQERMVFDFVDSH